MFISVVNEIPAPAPAVVAGPNAYEAYMLAMLEAVRSAPKDGTVVIDLRDTGWTNLKRDIFEAAALRGDVTIIILYDQWGTDYSLTIPAGTQLTEVVREAQYLKVTQLGSLLGLTPTVYRASDTNHF